MSDSSVELVVAWKAGDETAAERLFHRYFARLHGLVHSHLSEQMAARLDADDVLQSAFRSFFHGARGGRYVLERSGDLWRLLAAIAVHKLRHVQKRHSAGKRACAREQPLELVGEALEGDVAWLAREPTPEDAALLADEIKQLLRPLNDEQRRMVELRLEGFSLDEIAQEVHRSQRTVRRTMEQVKQNLERRFRGFDTP